MRSFQLFFPASDKARKDGLFAAQEKSSHRLKKIMLTRPSLSAFSSGSSSTTPSPDSPPTSAASSTHTSPAHVVWNNICRSLFIFVHDLICNEEILNHSL